eukprot:3727898-Rhodomonas_salina.2
MMTRRRPWCKPSRAVDQPLDRSSRDTPVLSRPTARSSEIPRLTYSKSCSVILGSVPGRGICHYCY